MIAKIIIFFLDQYQRFISPLLGNRCRFYPTCSEYAKEAIAHYGILPGSLRGTIRLLKCHPWHPGGFDPLISINHRVDNK